MRIFFLLCVAWMLVGCASKEIQYVDRVQEVKVPIKCNIELPERPILKPGFEGTKALVIYADQVTCVAKQCRGEICEVKNGK